MTSEINLKTEDVDGMRVDTYTTFFVDNHGFDFKTENFVLVEPQIDGTRIHVSTCEISLGQAHELEELYFENDSEELSFVLGEDGSVS